MYVYALYACICVVYACIYVYMRVSACIYGYIRIFQHGLTSLGVILRQSSSKHKFTEGPLISPSVVHLFWGDFSLIGMGLSLLRIKKYENILF